MNFGFNEQQEMIRDSVRKYAEAELLPNYKRWDRTGEWLPQDFIDKLVATGLLTRAERFIEGTVTPAPKPMTQRGMAIAIKL